MRRIISLLAALIRVTLGAAAIAAIYVALRRRKGSRASDH